MLRNKSIIQKDMSKCYVCGTNQGLHIHEIYYGTSNRNKSIRYGCYVSLCGYHHNLSKNGVHFDKALDRNLKEECQKQFEKEYSHERFIQIFKKSYL